MQNPIEVKIDLDTLVKLNQALACSKGHVAKQNEEIKKLKETRASQSANDKIKSLESKLAEANLEAERRGSYIKVVIQQRDDARQEAFDLKVERDDLLKAAKRAAKKEAKKGK